MSRTKVVSTEGLYFLVEGGRGGEEVLYITEGS